MSQSAHMEWQHRNPQETIPRISISFGGLRYWASFDGYLIQLQITILNRNKQSKNPNYSTMHFFLLSTQSWDVPCTIFLPLSMPLSLYVSINFMSLCISPCALLTVFDRLYKDRTFSTDCETKSSLILVYHHRTLV